MWKYNKNKYMRKHQQHSNIQHQSEFPYPRLSEDLIPISNCIKGHLQMNNSIPSKYLHRNPSINYAANKGHSSYRLYQDKKCPLNIYRLYDNIADEITEKNSPHCITNSQSTPTLFSKEYSKRINLSNKNIVKVIGIYLQPPKTNTKQEIAYPAILTQHIQPITSLGPVKDDKVVYQIILDWIKGIEYLQKEYDQLFFTLDASMLGYQTTKDNQCVGKIWLNEDFSKNKGQSIKILNNNREECYQKIILSIIGTLIRPFIKEKNKMINLFSSKNFQEIKHNITVYLHKNKQHPHFINLTVENRHCNKSLETQNPINQYYSHPNKSKERKSSKEGSRKISVYSGQKKYEKQESKHSNHSENKEVKVLKLGAKSKNKSIIPKEKQPENSTSKDHKIPAFNSNRQSLKKYREIKDLNYKIISPQNHTVANKCQWKYNQPLKNPFEIQPENQPIQNKQQAKVMLSPNPETISTRKVVNPPLHIHQLHSDSKRIIEKADRYPNPHFSEKQNVLFETKHKYAQNSTNKSPSNLFQTFIPSRKHQSTPSSLSNEIEPSKGNETKKQVSKNDLIRFQSYYDRIITQPLIPQKKTEQQSQEPTPLFKCDKSLSKITPIKPLLRIDAIDHELSTDSKQYKQLVEDNLTGNYDALKLNYQEWKQIYEFNNHQQQLSEEYLEEEQKNISMEISERDNEQSSQSFVQEQQNRNYSEIQDQSLERLKRNTGPIQIVESYITVLDESSKSLSNNKKIIIDESFIVKGKNKPEELSPTIKRQKREQWFKASSKCSQDECMSPINKLGSRELSRFPIAEEDSDIDQTKIFLFNPSNKRHVSCKFND